MGSKRGNQETSGDDEKEENKGKERERERRRRKRKRAIEGTNGKKEVKRRIGKRQT